MKEKLRKQDFLYDMEEVFEPVTENQKQSQNQTKLESEKQIQALRDCSQTTTGAIGQEAQRFVQAIQDQTRTIRESSKAMNEKID